MRLKQFSIGASSAIALCSICSVAFAGAVTSKEEIAISTTGGGIKIKSDNGNSFSLGGRIMYDFDSYDDAFNADNNGDSATESEFRRVRLEAKGSAGENWTYALTLDVSDNKASDSDDNDIEIDKAYLNYKGFNNVDLYLGRLNAPFSLEEMTSSKWISTVERAATSEVGGFLRSKPSFQLAAHGYTDSLFGQIAFIDEDAEDNDGSDSFSTALRGGGYFAFNGDNHFLHAAASYAMRDFGDDGTARFRSRFGVHTISRLTVGDGVSYEVDEANQYGLETAYVNGPFSAQAEYMSIDYDGDANGAGAIQNTDIDVDGYYMQLAYTLTGESRGYKSNIGGFDKIKPKGPRGAWELVARYEDGEVDPDNQASESEFELLTLGVNWYANNNLKFMLNYLDVETENFFSDGGINLDAVGEEDGSAITFRAQHAF